MNREYKLYLVWDTIKKDIPCIKLTVMKILDELE